MSVSDPASHDQQAAAQPAQAAAQPRRLKRENFFSRFFKIREAASLTTRLFWGSLSLAIIFFFWWWATRGPAEQRLISPATLGSPAEVFASFHSLWFERALTRNAAASIMLLLKGYGLALLVGLPLGILCGTFKRINAFFAPITLFGRNIPVVALVPLTMLWADTDEGQKVLFLFASCIAFVLYDTAQIIANVPDEYLDTAYTLGASRWQVIYKVLVPLALPDLFNSMRLLYGLAFGYIILAEMINLGQGGLGAMTFISMRRGPREHVYLLLLVITILAYGIDRLLFWIGRQLFPYRFR